MVRISLLGGYLDAISVGTGSHGLGGRVGDRVGDKLTTDQQRILELLAENPRMAASELAEVVGITKRNIEHNGAVLKKTGRLKRIGPAYGGYWEVLQ